MVYTTIAGLPGKVGRYTAFTPIVIYAFHSSRHGVGGPTSYIARHEFFRTIFESLQEVLASYVSIVVELSRKMSVVKRDDLMNEDELLSDDVLDKLAEGLPDGCMYCQVRNGDDLFFVEIE